MVQSGAYTFIGRECEKACKGIFDIKASSYCEEGIPFIRIADLKDMQIDLSDVAYITEECNKENSNSALSYGDIILSKTAVPAASVVNIPRCNVSQDTIAIKLKQSSAVDSFYAVAYLNSKIGLSLMESLFTGNIQKHFNLTDCKVKLPVPVFSEQIQKKVRMLMEQGISFSQSAQECYIHAEQMLLQELGLTGWRSTEVTMSTKSLAKVKETGRLDAEYYQPKYEEYLSKIKQYYGGITTVGEQFKQSQDQATFSLLRYNYIEIGDISVSSGEAKFNGLLTEDLPANAKYMISQGDILISKVRPYRGAVSIIDFEPQNLIASGAFTILREDGFYKKEVLATLLRTPIYRDWLLKWNVGSSYPVIKDQDILDLTIPLVPAEVQEKLAAEVQKSFALRRESKRVLERAKHAIEVAIEQGEAAAMKLLEDI